MFQHVLFIITLGSIYEKGKMLELVLIISIIYDVVINLFISGVIVCKLKCKYPILNLMVNIAYILNLFTELACYKRVRFKIFVSFNKISLFSNTNIVEKLRTFIVVVILLK